MNFLPHIKFLTLLIFVSGCAAMNTNHLKKSLDKSAYFNSHFTGFSLYDPSTDEYLYQWNEDKNFALASNTKLLTFYAGLVILGDSVPGLIYESVDDTLYFMSTCDPTFLHPVVERQPAFELLKDTTRNLSFVPNDFSDRRQAPGWTWEDYQYYYQPERSSFPIYGNAVSFNYDTINNGFSVSPDFFADFVEILDEPEPIPQRLENANIFAFAPDTSKSAKRNRVPFMTSDELSITLLEDTLNQKINWDIGHEFDEPDTLYSVPTLDLFAFMLKASDNLTAEHVLYLCAVKLGFEINSSLVRRHAVNNYFRHLKNQPVWRDGSGLSRYNLASPQFMIETLKLINEEISVNTMKQIMPIGGVDGSLRNWYKPKTGEPPYVFGKTGTFSNNHNLTGIIHTQSGKNLFFSFMNNNYVSGSTPVKQEMEKVMQFIYENY